MKKKFLLLFLIVFISCTKDNSDNVNETPFTPINLASVIVVNGYIANDPNVFPNTGQNAVINNQTDYSIFINKIISRNLTSYEGSTATTVNFIDKTVLTIVYNVVNEANHKLIIDNVLENSTNIVVHYHKINLYPDIQLPVISQPYIILEIPKSTKPVVFIEQTN